MKEDNRSKIENLDIIIFSLKYPFVHYKLILYISKIILKFMFNLFTVLRTAFFKILRAEYFAYA